MKKLIINCLIVLVVGALCRQAGAQVTTYVSSLGNPSTESLPVSSDSWLAAGFLTGDNMGGYFFDSVQLGLADASGNPNGFSLDSKVFYRGAASPIWMVRSIQ
jgi:hypothetical protein